MQALGRPDPKTNSSAQLNLFMSFNLLKLLELLAYLIINLQLLEKLAYKVSYLQNFQFQSKLEVILLKVIVQQGKPQEQMKPLLKSQVKFIQFGHKQLATLPQLILQQHQLLFLNHEQCYLVPQIIIHQLRFLLVDQQKISPVKHHQQITFLVNVYKLISYKEQMLIPHTLL